MPSSEVHFHAIVMQSTVGKELAQDPFVTARAGLEPATFRMQGTGPTTESPLDLGVDPNKRTSSRVGSVLPEQSTQSRI